MKISPPKSVLDQLRLQVQLDRQLAELGEELQTLPEITGTMARVGARTAHVFGEVAPQSDFETDFETASEEFEEAQRAERFPLAKQVGVLRDALSEVLPGAGEDEPREGEPESEGAPVLISRLAQGVASLERTVYSSALLCQVTGTLLRALKEDAADETDSLSVSFFYSANRLQQVVDFLNGFSAQNSQATLSPTDRERLIQYLKEAQKKLDEFEGPELPKQAEYTPAFFARRHDRTPTSIRNQFKHWGERRNNPTALKKEGRWIISNYDIAKQFDKWLCTVRREKSSASS